MPGAGELEENKIFKDIALGTTGKGKYAGKRDMKKYRECPLWANLEAKKAKEKAARETADVIENMVYDEVYGADG